MGEIVAYLIIIAFFGLFGFLAYRALKTTNPVAKNGDQKSDSEKK